MHPDRRLVKLGPLAIALLAACQSAPHDRAAVTADQMSDLRGTVIETKGRAATAVDSLDALVEGRGGQAKAVYEQFASDVDATDAGIVRMENQLDSVRMKAQRQFDAWQAQLPTITDASLRRRSSEHRLALKRSLEDLEKAMSETSETMAPFVTQLRDARVYLSNDLSSEGMSSLRDAAAKIRGEKAGVEKALDSFAATIDELEPKFRAAQPMGTSRPAVASN